LKRDATGRHETTIVRGETVRAFVPNPLPPVPPLLMDGGLQPLLEAAVLALGRLDGVSTLLPDKALPGDVARIFDHILLRELPKLPPPGRVRCARAIAAFPNRERS